MIKKESKKLMKISIRLFSAMLMFLLWNSMLNFAQNSNNKVMKVVIDAGHGGKDPGCRGKLVTEKSVALNVALKTGKYIEERIPNVEVIYTRSSDKFVELNERAEIANRANADLFISIHANAQRKGSSVYGTETFVMGLHKSDANAEVAMRENAVIELEDNYELMYDGFDPKSPEAYIMFSLYQDAYLNQSIEFAAKVEEQFSGRAGRHSRGVKQAGFLVLYKTTMPSVLIEVGFLTNATEEKYLASEHGEDIIASAIYRAFKDYKDGVTNLVQN